MKNSKSIVGIYSYLNFKRERDEKAAYYLLYLFNDEGFIDLELIQKNYIAVTGEQPKQNQNYIGPFNNMKILNQFSYRICEDLPADCISILSLNKYNEALIGTAHAEELFSNLVNNGNIIKNVNKKSSNLFGKIFS